MTSEYPSSPTDYGIAYICGVFLDPASERQAATGPPLGEAATLFNTDMLEESPLGRTFDGEAKSLTPRCKAFLKNTVRHFTLKDRYANDIGNRIWVVKAARWLTEQHPEFLETLPVSGVQGKNPQPVLSFMIGSLRAWAFPLGIRLFMLEVRAPRDSAGCRRPVEYLEAVTTHLTRGAHRVGEEKHAQSTKIQLLEPARESNVPESGSTNPLNAALAGQPISLAHLFTSMIPGDCESLQSDRYLTLSLVSTAGHGDNPEEFTADERTFLTRIAKGMHDAYRPKLDDDAHQVVFTHPMGGTLVAAAPEGVSLWSKQLGQPFRIKHFTARFEQVYIAMFVLAVYQRFALARFLERLNQAASKWDHLSANGHHDEHHFLQILESLRALRYALGMFVLRSMFPEPSVLANQSAFYHTMQRALSTSKYIRLVNEQTREIEHLAERQHELDVLRHTGESLHHHHTRENRVFSLVLLAEVFGGLYYSSQVWNYVVTPIIPGAQQEWAPWFALCLTGAVVLVTLTVFGRNRWRQHKEKQQHKKQYRRTVAALLAPLRIPRGTPTAAP